jgi:hypothetical protein
MQFSIPHIIMHLYTQIIQLYFCYVTTTIYQTHGNHGDENRNTTNETIPISSLCFPLYLAGVHKKGVEYEINYLNI